MPQRSRARHWSRTAFALAVLFGSMAVGSRLLLGAWPFDGAPELAWVCVGLAVYFHILGRRFAALPDPAELLDEALQLASSGRIDEAIALLGKTVRQSPQLWQAFQYRGELHLLQQNAAAAVEDFTEAIRLAPDERHLYELRSRATSDFGTTPASRDSEAR